MKKGQVFAPRHRRCPVWLVPLLLLLWLPAAQAGGSAIEAAALPWRSLAFEAQKWFARGEFEVHVEALPPEEAAALSPAERGAPLMPCGGMLLVNGRMKFLSSEARLRLWIDPLDFHMYERWRYTVGSEGRFKTARFLENGLWWVRHEPGDLGESVHPGQWPVSRQKLIAYPSVPTSPRWLDPAELLLAVSALGMAEPGESVTVPVFTDQQPYRATLRVEGEAAVEVDYVLVEGERRKHVDGERRVTRISVAPTPLAEFRYEPEFNLLGLTGDISIYLDPVNGVPVQLEGEAESRGRLTVHLREVTMAGSDFPPLTLPAGDAAAEDELPDACDRSLNILRR